MPGCRGAEWLAEREAELLPVPYFYVVFTLPAAIAEIAYQNKAVIYNLLFKASSEKRCWAFRWKAQKLPTTTWQEPQTGIGKIVWRDI